MAAETKHSCYEGTYVNSFQFYLERSGEHKAILQCAQHVLPQEFKKYNKKCCILFREESLVVIVVDVHWRQDVECSHFLVWIITYKVFQLFFFF